MRTPISKTVRVAALLVAIAMLCAGVQVRALSRQAESTSAPLLPAYRTYDTIPAELPYYLNSLADPARNRLYVVTRQKLAVYDIEKRQHLGDVMLYNNELGRIAVGRDGRRIYLSGYPGVSSSEIVQVIDTAAMAMGPTFLMPCKPSHQCPVASIATGPGNRLYVMIDVAPGFRVMDGASGQALRTITHATEGTVDGLATAGNKLYVIDKPEGEAPMLYRYDISDVDPVLEDAEPIPDTGAWGSSVWLSVSPDGSLLLRSEGGTGLDVFDANTLELVASRVDEDDDFAGLPGTGFRSATFASDGEVLAAVLTNTQLVMLALTSDTLEPVRKANQSASDFSHLAFAGLTGRNVAHIYADHIALLAPNDFAAAVPLAMANHCDTGPIVDDFSDLDSGWPIADNGVTAIGYSGETYKIRHREPGRIVLVTRGDVWRDSERYNVTGWLKSGDQGLYGIVFGLNNDWTEFYTLEVRPDTDYDWLAAYILHYTAEDGWELIYQTKGLFIVYPGTAHNQLGIERHVNDQGINQLVAMVNNQPLKVLPAVSGLIGLVGESLPWADVDIRFDDYFFRGQNCWSEAVSVTGRASVRVMERPPLEDLLR